MLRKIIILFTSLILMIAACNCVAMAATYTWPIYVGARITNTSHTFNGVSYKATDFGVPVGTNVYAVADGTVISVVSQTDSYGKYIIIDHGNNVYSLYAHLSEFKVAKGDRVVQGQTIALSGNTGNSTGPHLHFEIRVGGNSTSYSKNIRDYCTEVNVNPSDAPSYLTDPLVYNATAYRTIYYQDLGGFDDAALLSHWLNHGVQEGRRASYVFDVKEYLQYNSDLQTAYGTDYKGAINHFVSFGINEGRRSCKEFNLNTYKSENILSFGTNREYYEHFLQFGIYEGRTASSSFKMKDYAHNYAELRSAFGTTNYEPYYVHWLQFGRKEGRVGTPADTTSPTIKNVQVTNVTYNGYTISCEVTDDLVGVKQVTFATFTNAETGNNAKWVTVSPVNGKYTYTVKASDHGNSVNTYYNTHIYADDKTHSDNAGNASTVYRQTVYVPAKDTTAPQITGGSISNVTAQNVTFTVQATDNVGVDHADLHVWTGTWSSAGEKVYKLNKSGNSWSYNVPINLNDGKEWIMDVRVFDAAGNQALTSGGYPPANARLKMNTLSFDPNGGVCEIGSRQFIFSSFWCETGNTVTYGSKYETLPASSRAGYEFDGWYTSASGGTKITAETKVTSNSNQTLYAHWTPLWKEITPAVLPESLKVIDEEAFMGSDFEYVYLPDTVETINARAFAGCSELHYIRISENVTYIAEDAFEGAAELAIIGTKDSSAYSYANENGIDFFEE